MTKEERKAKMLELAPAVMADEIHDLIKWLDIIGFFDAPASTKYHGAYEGGLFDHSLKVYEALKGLTDQLKLEWKEEESPFVIAFLHDICKVDQYIKNGDGWKYNTDTLLTGHGEKSVMMLTTSGFCFNPEEIACIRYHMGAFTDKEQWNSYTGAIHHYPNVLWVHTADMVAAHLWGV